MESEGENAAKIAELEVQIRSMSRSIERMADVMSSNVGRVGPSQGEAPFMAHLMKSLDQERADRRAMLERQDPLKMLVGFLEVADSIRGDVADVGGVDPKDGLKLIQNAIALGTARAAAAGQGRGSNGTEQPGDAPDPPPNPRAG